MAHALTFGRWTVSIPPLLVFYLLLVGTSVKHEDRPIVAAAGLVIMLAGYSAVYVFTPRDVLWHVTTSIDRLFSQSWPALVFVFFLVVRTPEEALSKKDVIRVPA